MPDPVALPDGRQLAVTWGLDREFGGMTSALLRRSRSFAGRAGRPVEIVTFDLRDDYAEVEADLRSRGLLAAGLRHVNLWDDLTARTEYPAALPGTASKSPAFAPLDGAPLSPSDRRTVTRTAEDGTLLQVDRYRADGTLAISDRRDTRAEGTIGGRATTLCDGKGRPAHAFTRIRPLYRAWLDLLLGEDEAFLIVDSKASAPTIAEYDNPRVTTIHLLHNSHLVGDRRPWDRVKASRREALAALPLFDATVVLSERQRDDLALLLGTRDRIEVVPNSAPLPTDRVTLRRASGTGVSIGSLDARKRVEHSVDAVSLAREQGAGATLDIFGDGPHRAALESRAESSGGAVRLHGFRSDAIEAFASASFFTLTSTTEGFPLVLAEGMARGCIPVSYDIPYGPADIIEHGVSGFLLPPGDVQGLAETIARIASTDPEDLAPLRTAAVEAAAAFSDAAVTDAWAEVLTRARDRRRNRGRPFALETVSTKIRRVGTEVDVVVDFRLRGLDVSPGDLDAAIALRGTATAIELRRPAEVGRTLRRGVWRATARVESAAAEWLPADEELAPTLEARIRGRLARTS